jgi:hypothetical protein
MKSDNFFRSIFFLVLTVSIMKSFGQVSPKDSIVSGFIIDFHYGFHLPEGDLKERFGSSAGIGVGLVYKDKKNFLYSLDMNYEFGTKVKIEDSIFKDLFTQEGFIIDGDGLFAEVFTYERGWIGLGKIGKIFPVFGPNENCGPFIMVGAGYMTHKIRIYNQDMTAPQIKDEYKKGYDRLTGGYCFSQQIGYHHIGNKKAYSFTVSFEIIEAFTKPMRNYQFDLKGPESSSTRTDILYGLRLSWMIPLFRQPSDGYFIF